MAMRCFLILAISFIITSTLGADEEQDIYTKAASCPHRFHMGCMLDVLEKTCTGLQQIQACADQGKCKNVEELQRITGALEPKTFEALSKCCCTKAFADGGYEDCKNPDPVCKKAITDHVEPNLKENLKLLKKCLKKKKQAVCKEAIGAANWVLEAIQKARGTMWTTEGCKILAPPEPASKCGWDVKPEPRAIERADLYCDTIIWQFKEMGASDPFMAQCPNAPKMPVEKEEEKEQEEEKEPQEEPEEPEDAEEPKAKKPATKSDSAASATEETGEDIYSKASKCPHRSHMGCLMELVEKSCEATRELSTCVNKGQCENEEVKRFLVHFPTKESKKAFYKCCCKKAYQCKKPHEKCFDTVNGMAPKDTAKLEENMTAYKDAPTKKNAKKAIKAVAVIREYLQKVRGALRKKKGCDIMAPMEPLVKCGWLTGANKPIERDDLNCESLIWQYKEMSIMDPEISKCPGAPKIPMEEEGADQDSMEGSEEEGSQDEGGEEDQEAEEPAHMKDEL